MDDLNGLKKDLLNFENDFNNTKPKMIKTLADELQEKIKENTPVDTGRLSNSYKIDTNKDNGYVYTDVEYAKYVNDGHIRGNSFVQGKHMYENGLTQFEANSGVIVDGLLSKIRGL